MSLVPTGCLTLPSACPPCASTMARAAARYLAAFGQPLPA